MPKKKKVSQDEPKRKYRKAISPEARENQLISLAYDLVEQRLLDGSATSQETTSLIRLGTAKARLESEKLRRENMLLTAKTESIESAKNQEELYLKAIKAMSEYGSHNDYTADVELMKE